MAEETATIERPVCSDEAKMRPSTKAKGSGGKRRTRPATASEPTAGEHNQELGRRGEDAAARFLERRGYDIIARNWTCLAGEADIIARDGEMVVFVEVKTRSSCEKGLPSQAVNDEKRKRYKRIAELFLHDYEAEDVAARFDIVAIVVAPPDRAIIRHYIHAFVVG